MKVYIAIWTFTDWISSDTETIGVYRDVGSAFRALIKKGIEDEYILNETTRVKYDTHYTYDTPEKFASFLYEKYIAVEDNLENMNVGLENLRWDCGTSDFHERFLGCVCVNEFQ
jgi:hypothetical protein